MVRKHKVGQTWTRRIKGRGLVRVTKVGKGRYKTRKVHPKKRGRR